jgi:hypothetical protein
VSLFVAPVKVEQEPAAVAQGQNVICREPAALFDAGHDVGVDVPFIRALN